jgi:uncharacterized linocin/CFP29 family protein
MNDLLRELAPISAEAWQQIEDEAKRTLTFMLAARKLVDFTGPLGWDASAVNSGRVETIDTAEADAQVRLRTTQPLVEVRVPFQLERRELEAVRRGAKDPDLDPVRVAARKAALMEDRAVFHGYAGAGIRGINEVASSRALMLSDDYTAYPGVVAEAIHSLHSAGIGGPYAIALGPRCYTGLTKTTKGGFPVIEHVRKLLEGPIVWAPAVNGASVLSSRGDDFELIVGQDFSIGYLDHTADSVRLYIQESFTFRALSPEAAIPLKYPTSGTAGIPV